MAARIGFRRAVTALGATVGSVSLLLIAVAPAQAAPATFSGIVTFKGVPQADVVVGTYDTTGEHLERQTSTNSSGRYTLKVPTGPYFIWTDVFLDLPDLSAGPHVSGTLSTFEGASSAIGAAYQNLTPIAGNVKPGRVNLSLLAATTISGANLHLPIGSTVLLETGNGDRVASTTTTDFAGRYSFGVAAGSYRLVVPATGDFQTYTSAAFTVTEGKPVVKNPANVKGATIRGRITVQRIGVYQELITLTRAGHPACVTISDNSGNWEFEALPAGTYTVTVGGTSAFEDTATNWLPQAKTFKNVKVGSISTYNLSTASDNLPFTGSLSAAFQPETGATESAYYVMDEATGQIVASQANLRADDEGQPGEQRTAEVTAYGLSTGTYRVVAFDDVGKHYYAKDVKVTAGKFVRLGSIHAASPSLTLSGTVSRSNASETVTATSNVTALTDSMGDTTPLVKRSVRVSASGAYRITGLAPAPYAIKVTAPYQATVKYRLNLTKSATEIYKHGAAVGKVAFAGALVNSGDSLNGIFTMSSGSKMKTNGSRGAPSIFKAAPGRYTISTTTVAVTAEVQPGMAFHFTVPKGRSTFTVTAGKTVSLASIPITVKN